MRILRLPRALACLVACGCVPRHALPMTSMALVQRGTAPALVAYLEQPGASPSVCDKGSRGPHLPELTEEMRQTLVNELVSGNIQPDVWSACISRALGALDPDRRVPSLEGLARVFQERIVRADLEEDPMAAERLAAILRVYLELSSNRSGALGAAGLMSDELRESLEKDKLGPVAKGFMGEVLASLDVERGHWGGQPVDIPMMDRLASDGNEMTLMRFVERLPSASLRKEAARRVIRICIALSPFPEVREAAAAVEETVLAEGRHRIDIADHPVVRAWFDLERIPVQNVLIRQSVWTQTATLLGYSANRPRPSVLPELSLRGALWAQLASLSRPLSICGPKRDLDPTPCIAIEDLSLENPLTFLDGNDSVHFSEAAPVDRTLFLAHQGRFAIPVTISGQPAAFLDWGVYFERPEDLRFESSSAGGFGPPVDVRAERVHPYHWVFTASAPAGTFTAVVRTPDLTRFRVESRGGDGYPGASGMNGMPGSDGGECQNGGNGGNGGPGGNGDPGGDGGDVRAWLSCGVGDCQEALALVRGVVASVGGSGGAGGDGGAGGSGGSGGSGRSQTTHTDENGTVVVDDYGCSSGTSGMPGSRGPSGMAGPDGRPGRVTVQVVR